MKKTSTISLAVAALLGSVDATYVYGRCPQIKYGWEETHPGKDLDHKKLEGMWGNVWEAYHRLTHSDCMSMKLHQMDEKNSTRYQMFQGVSWKEDDEVIFDDHTVLVFNHPEKSYLAAVSSPEDIDGEKDHEQLHQFDSLSLPDLDEE
jgi:hypothetical protein